MKARHKASKGKGPYGTSKYPRTYDARWQHFSVFLAEMGERPECTTLDRIDPLNGVYYKGNCRWATRVEQDYNRPDTIMYNLGDNITGSALDWSREFSTRLGAEMSIEDFKTIVKYFTVEQLWSSLHPQALTVQQLRDAEVAANRTAEQKANDEAVAKAIREMSQMREDDWVEDTGQVFEEDMEDLAKSPNSVRKNEIELPKSNLRKNTEAHRVRTDMETQEQFPINQAATATDADWYKFTYACSPLNLVLGLNRGFISTDAVHSASEHYEWQCDDARQYHEERRGQLQRLMV